MKYEFLMSRARHERNVCKRIKTLFGICFIVKK